MITIRTLILMRGTPSSGKTTWLERNNLKKYSLSADDFRMLYRGTVIDKNGKENIDQSVNSLAWKNLYEVLEMRMKFGEFTIIDACNSKAKEMNAYKALAEKYRYRIYCVDFTDIPIEQAKEWNKQRPEYKQVPENSIDLYYSRFQTQKIPSGIKVISRDDFFEEVSYKPINLDSYNSVTIIGDIHGCNTALQELLNNKIEENNFYIFLGDYLDRGIENKEVLEFMISIKDLPNVCLLEGNHESKLWDYSNDCEVVSKDFIKNTIPQIYDIDKKDIRQFYRKLRQCAYFTYNGETYFCSHAGISALVKNPVFYATQDFIKGIGDYGDIYDCEDTFSKSNPNMIQFHGHRNPNNLDVQNKNSYNLEGRVEFGGELRAAIINKDNTIEIKKIKNNIFREVQDDQSAEQKQPENLTSLSIFEIVNELRKDKKLIMEKRFDDFDISSFNFTKDVFYDKTWNDMTTKARGLFINTNSMTIANRAYEKFFCIGERKETELSTLSNTLKFPVNAYVKYNGFLGMLGYDEKNDKLLFSSKSSIGGPFSDYFKNIFMEKYSDKYDDILKFIKERNVSFIFEVIDKDNDPHIIEYKENNIILLDIVFRDIEFKKIDYTNLCNIANKFGLIVKEKAYTIGSWAEFLAWYTEVTDVDYLYKGEVIEGFVIEDSKGFMTKIKGYYYNFWKFMRKIKDEVFRPTKLGVKGYIDRTQILTDADMNFFYGFICNLAKSGYEGKTDIISLRNLYFKNKK